MEGAQTIWETLPTRLGGMGPEYLQQPRRSNPRLYKLHLSTSSTSVFLDSLESNDIKLTYLSMLEDSAIRHLISWSPNNESFVMSPSNEFSKVLS